MSYYGLLRYHSNELRHHGILGPKWGVKNGPPYPLNSQKLAESIYKNAKRVEPQITRDISRSAKSCGFEQYGLEHRLKTKESIQRKIETDSLEKGLSEYQAAEDIKDAVRYTLIASNDTFVQSYNNFKSIFSALGYSEIRCKNYFVLYKQKKVKHKSVQSVFTTSDGYRFEIQFHTPNSQSAKDKKIPLYEERRKPGLTDQRKRELEKQMEDLAILVPYPKNISKIESH